MRTRTEQQQAKPSSVGHPAGTGRPRPLPGESATAYVGDSSYSWSPGDPIVRFGRS